MPLAVKEAPALYTYDAAVRAQAGPLLCGIDEAGRGPLCGPVACAAVILDPEKPVPGVNDSKKLSEPRREELYAAITQSALAWNVVLVGPERIDAINILNATMEGMAAAAAGLGMKPDRILVDGNRTPPGLPAPAQCVVKGDAISACVAAASILAKVTRDRLMAELDAQYPQYGLAQHKGYGTAQHIEALQKYGPAPFYRQSFLKKLALPAPGQALGQKGEAVAAKYYRQNGCLLLDHNYRTRFGELDVIAYRDGTVIFAEVKTRAGAQKGAPADAVDEKKRRRLASAARQWLQNSPYADAPVRFDVVEVLPADAEGRWRVHCIENAFTEP